MSFRYEARCELWKWSGGSWHFLTLPAAFTEGLKTLRGKAPGFGSVRVEASVGATAWRTSLFPDSKSGSFLLPVKAEVRKREGLAPGDIVDLAVEVLI